MREIQSCEVCLESNLSSVLDLGSQPLCDGLLPIGAQEESDLFPIEILICSTCLTCHQRFQPPKEILFPANYHYRSGLTQDVLSGMASLTKSVELLGLNLKNAVVLDVGCNDGSLLDIFKMRGAKTVGVEPTNAAVEALAKGHSVTTGFFDNVTAEALLKEHSAFDLISFTNVFAHIEFLGDLLETIDLLLTAETLLVIENHYLGSVVEGNQFDTFYHEHPRSYSLTSFLFIAERLNARILKVEFPGRYGGNIRVIMRKLRSTDPDFASENIVQKERKVLGGEWLMQQHVETWRSKMFETLDSIALRSGPIPCKAFPGRASIMINLLQLEEYHLEAAYEKPSSPKIGHQIPGTQIPILSEQNLFEKIEDVSLVLNLAWHISDEISQYLRDGGFQGQILDIH